VVIVSWAQIIYKTIFSVGRIQLCIVVGGFFLSLSLDSSMRDVRLGVGLMKRRLSSVSGQDSNELLFFIYTFIVQNHGIWYRRTDGMQENTRVPSPWALSTYVPCLYLHNNTKIYILLWIVSMVSCDWLSPKTNYTTHKMRLIHTMTTVEAIGKIKNHAVWILLLPHYTCTKLPTIIIIIIIIIIRKILWLY